MAFPASPVIGAKWGTMGNGVDSNGVAFLLGLVFVEHVMRHILTSPQFGELSVSEEQHYFDREFAVIQENY